jgi:hypothetical protein
MLFSYFYKEGSFKGKRKKEKKGVGVLGFWGIS